MIHEKDVADSLNTQIKYNGEHCELKTFEWLISETKLQLLNESYEQKTENAYIPVEQIWLNKIEYVITVNGITTVHATCVPQNASIKKLIYRTSDPNVFTIVSDGVILGHGIGEATLTVLSAYDETVYTTAKVIVDSYEDGPTISTDVDWSAVPENILPALPYFTIGDETTPWYYVHANNGVFNYNLETSYLKATQIDVDERGLFVGDQEVATKKYVSEQIQKDPVDWDNLPALLPADLNNDVGSVNKPWDRVWTNIIGLNNASLYFNDKNNVIYVPSTFAFSDGISYIDKDGNADLQSVAVDGEPVATQKLVEDTQSAISDWVADNFVKQKSEQIEVYGKARPNPATLFFNSTDGGWKLKSQYGEGLKFDNISYDGYEETVLKIDERGNLYVQGDITQRSDKELKDVLSYTTNISINDIANAPICYFRWKNSSDTTQHIGTLAQYWKQVVPECVHGEEGNMAMNYSTIGLVSSVVNARKIVEQEERIKTLEDEIKALKELVMKEQNQ